MQPAGPARLLGDRGRREPQALQPIADQAARLLRADQERQDADRPDLAVGSRVDHHGLAAERARAGEARRLEAEVGPARAALGRDLLARRRLAAGRAQGLVERGLDDLDRGLDDPVAMPAIAADQLGGAGSVAEHRTALLAGELAQLRRGYRDAARARSSSPVLSPPQGPARHPLSGRAGPAAERPRAAA